MAFGLWLLLILPSVSVGPYAPWLPFVAELSIIAVATALYQRVPLVALFVVAIGAMVDDPSMLTEAYIFALPFFGYSVGRRMENQRQAMYALLAILVAGSVVNVLVPGDPYEWFVMVAVLVFAVVFPWLLGRYRRHYDELVASGWQRAEQLEIAQDAIAAQERLRERSRIAQDMHDSLGHDLALITLRAGALEVTPGLDSAHRAAVKELRISAGAATERLQDIIGVLREEPTAPLQPRDESIAQLVARAADSGLPVHFDGAPAKPLTPVPDAIRWAAHRVAQEALTNAAKHAPGAQVQVKVRESPAQTVLTITNPITDSAKAPGGQRGLAGLAERVRLVGGTLDAGISEGAFVVKARLPHQIPAQEDKALDSVRHLASVRRRVRQGLITAIAVPIALGAFLVIGYFGFFFWGTWNSTLEASDYSKMRVGQSESSVRSSLPIRQYWERPPVDEPAKPEGARCEYYRSTRNLFVDNMPIYRLCFKDKQLLTKNVVFEDKEAERPQE